MYSPQSGSDLYSQPIRITFLRKRKSIFTFPSRFVPSVADLFSVGRPRSVSDNVLDIGSVF